MKAFAAILRRDLRLVLRQGADGMLVIGFFVMATAMFPFAIGPDAAMLEAIAAGRSLGLRPVRLDAVPGTPVRGRL